MASGHNDPKLLYAIEGIAAYHLSYGKEEPLTPAGPQTLSLLMVPTSSPFADPTTFQNGTPQEDFYLHLHLPPELDIPLPATTQIYHQPPTSYLIPRWDLGPDSGAFTRLEFPALGSRPGLQEDVDTFETILAQCTAFLERASPPKATNNAKGLSASPASAAAAASSGYGETKEKAALQDELPPYDPSSFGPGRGYAQGSHSSAPEGGHLVLVDEEDGSVLGELGEDYQVVENAALKAGSKDPVEITLPAEGGHNISVAPAPREYMDAELHPAYQKSTLVSKAAYASHLIITTSDKVARTLQNQADSYAQKSQPSAKAVTFTPATHDRVRRISKLSSGVADLSSKTVGQVNKYAQNLGATLSRRKESATGTKGIGPDGQPQDNYKPGLLNKSLMAFSTISDGLEHASRNVLNSTSTAATSVVAHKWGPEAGELSRHLGGSVKNVGLVYIDVTGVSRRAIIKAAGKGMVVGRVKGGGQIVVNDSAAVPDADGQANLNADFPRGVPSSSAAVDGKQSAR